MSTVKASGKAVISGHKSYCLA